MAPQAFILVLTACFGLAAPSSIGHRLPHVTHDQLVVCQQVPDITGVYHWWSDDGTYTWFSLDGVQIKIKTTSLPSPAPVGGTWTATGVTGPGSDGVYTCTGLKKGS